MKNLIGIKRIEKKYRVWNLKERVNLMLKKLTIALLMILAVIFTVAEKSYGVVDANKINKQVNNILEEAVKEYLEPFKSDEIPEEERIVDYFYNGYGVQESENNIGTKYEVDFQVTPVNKDNTIWMPRKNIIFVDLTYENEEFSIEKISDKPENLDKFMERFEEYQKTKTEEKSETVQIAPKEIKTAKQEQIEKINIRIYIISGIVLCGGIVVLVVSIRKNKKI